MSDAAARFAARYPVVWHVMEADGAGPWVAKTGLFPAAEIYRFAGLQPDGANRDTFQQIDFGSGRTAILRLQQMRDNKLLPTLAGRFTGRPDLWRQHIDSHVFFWATPQRRDRFIAATRRDRAKSRSAHSSKPPVIIEVDTEGLLQKNKPLAYFATFNTGTTVLYGAKATRDESTFRPVSQYCSGPVAELAIRGHVDLSGTTVRAIT